MQIDGIKGKIDANNIDDLDMQSVSRTTNVNVAGTDRQTEASGVVDDLSHQDARILVTLHGPIEIALKLHVLQIRGRERHGYGHQRQQDRDTSRALATRGRSASGLGLFG